MTRSGDVLRAGARGIGELLITVGLVLLLFVAYQLVWTNLEAERAQSKVADQIRERWRGAQGNTAEAFDGPEVRGLGFLRIPRLGKGYSVPVVQGVGLDELARGIGHYPGTVRAGQVGNFAVAGHRATHGEPFAHLDRIRPGDVVVAETRRHWFTYVVDETRIVDPSDVWVIDPVPGEPGAEPTEALLTLTTCNPRWASTERLVVFGHLEDERPRSLGPPPVLTRKG
ncbi:MAG: sortase [Actinomycetota bacterium]|nr:sortase [Actinomycetota bacterium]